jgi:hypothetical protein
MSIKCQVFYRIFLKTFGLFIIALYGTYHVPNGCVVFLSNYLASWRKVWYTKYIEGDKMNNRVKKRKKKKIHPFFILLLPLLL